VQGAENNKHTQLRLRVFAGPNGSGKSTVIQYVRDLDVNCRPIDFGIYINADDIAKDLRENNFSFNNYDIQVTNREFVKIALTSGLVNPEFGEIELKKSYSFRKNAIKLKQRDADERLAQILADFLRKKLLLEKRKFSFETVFSHPSKLDIMRQATSMGYKVYLYFVSTESPHINTFRVAARKAKGGHDVPPEKITARYYRSLELLYQASQIAYQAYFFDNSKDGEDFRMFAHFKRSGSMVKWESRNKKNDPVWFKKYYAAKR